MRVLRGGFARGKVCGMAGGRWLKEHRLKPVLLGARVLRKARPMREVAGGDL